MSPQLQPDDALAANAAQDEATQPQPVPPLGPVAPASPGRRGLLLRVLKGLERWGIPLALGALLMSLVTYCSDYIDRVEERRVQAWQLLLATAPGNSGKREALEYLNKDVTLLWIIPLKPRTELTGIKLGAYSGKDQSGAWVGGVYLRGVQLPSANLRSAQLNGADLTGANLSDTDLGGADLQGAILEDAHLKGSVLSGADLTGAHGLTQRQLDDACGDRSTNLPDRLTIRPCE
jgi:Pentapeptide repeats (8 copies)